MDARSRVFSILATALLVAAPGLAAPASSAASGVRTAQVRLNRLGCDAGRADGVVDMHLRAAVVRFQSANRLARTGHLGAATRNRLKSPRARRCDVRPVPARSGSGRRIVLSQRQNWVWLVRADGAVVAQGGMVDNDWLPQRTYYTGAQCGRPARSRYRTDESGRLWLDYFVRFTDCIVGFHQIPVDRRSGRQVHPSWYAGTDYRESHGCIRLPPRMARAVWVFTVSRTKVVVVAG